MNCSAQRYSKIQIRKYISDRVHRTFLREINKKIKSNPASCEDRETPTCRALGRKVKSCTVHRSCSCRIHWPQQATAPSPTRHVADLCLQTPGRRCAAAAAEPQPASQCCLPPASHHVAVQFWPQTVDAPTAASTVRNTRSSRYRTTDTKRPDGYRPSPSLSLPQARLVHPKSQKFLRSTRHIESCGTCMEY